jgi:UDP:flavonoid glycosyltransferase YjiC (YdhE family)
MFGITAWAVGGCGIVTKFVMAAYGTRGDVEPCVVVGRELVRRGHDVRLAVPPDLVWFVESAGLAAVGYGLDTKEPLEAARNFFGLLFRSFWKVKELAVLWRGIMQPVSECWENMSVTLTSLADGADVLLAAQTYQEPAANVAESHGIPFATMHYFPLRPNSQIIPSMPAGLVRSSMRLNDWVFWRLTKRIEDAQRRELGLPRATMPASRRIAERGSLELQGYDEVCFPGLAAEWAEWNGQRPFVGTLTMELATEADEEVMSWIARGTPPIFFGFGSIPVESPADTAAMISEACAQLGERALICAGWSDFSDVPQPDHVKVVPATNYATVFPSCRAVVHHGGAATTPIGLRSGVPTLILWMLPEQSYWGAQIKRLEVGFARRFSRTTRETLIADLRRILNPECTERAREIATRLTKPEESAVLAADLLERLADGRA